MVVQATATQAVILGRVLAARQRQNGLFGVPDSQNIPLAWLAGLATEFGAVARAVPLPRPGDGPHAPGDPAALRRALTETVAVGLAWLEALEQADAPAPAPAPAPSGPWEAVFDPTDKWHTWRVRDATGQIVVNLEAPRYWGPEELAAQGAAAHLIAAAPALRHALAALVAQGECWPTRPPDPAPLARAHAALAKAEARETGVPA